MPFVTIKIAGAGTKTSDGDTSLAGHMWYSLDDGYGNTTSYGFGPAGDAWWQQPCGPGDVNVHGSDDNYYLSTNLAATIEISWDQYNAMKSFGDAPSAGGFDMTYNGAANSCVDFTWKALEQAGLNPTAFEGTPLPTNNMEFVLGYFPNGFCMCPSTADPNGTCPVPPFLPPPPAPKGAKDILPNSVAPSYSPIILDLDGDGVETLGVGSGVQFDLDNNSFRETVGWAGADDGLLALDKNGDGRITGGTELFGNHTTLESGNKAANGFLALAEYDDNNDGRIDENDAVYANLRVWRDVNANGESEAGELLTLAEAGVSQLNLANTYSTTIDAQGNSHRQLGSYVDANGNTRAMTDVWFDVDPTRTKPLTDVPIPDAIMALPEAQGSGNVRSLRETMALDTSGKLQELVERFVAETDPVARKTLLPEIMFQWIGGKCAHLDDGYFADGWGNGNAGAYFRTSITQEQYSVLEAFIGTVKFFNNDGSASILLNRYQQLEDMVFYQLMSQTHLKGLYQLVSFTQDEASQTWRGDYSLAAMAITLRAMEAPEETAGMLADFLRSVRGVNPYITENTDAVRREFESIIKTGWQERGIQALATTVSAFYLGTSDKADMLNVGQLGDKYTGMLFGGGGNDTLSGGVGDDVLGGDAGNDVLRGYDGNDLLIGGTGDDTLYGGTGDDTYLFSLGDGQDTISNFDDSTGIDTLAFGEGITLSSLQLQNGGFDLVIKIGDAGDEVKLANWYHPYYPASRMDRFTFADGTVLTRDEFLAQKPVYSLGTEANNNLQGHEGVDIMQGGGGNDSLGGDAGNDSLDGGDGDDSLRGDDGNDQLKGGQGNDTLHGGTGDDTYLFNLGDGQDTISNFDDSTGIDTLAFGEDITLSSLQLQNAGFDLVIKIGDAGDEVKLANWYHPYYPASRMDRFTFADGTVLTRDEFLAQKPVYSLGTEANNNLQGHEGADIIQGGGGEDSLWGDAGNDSLDGGAGDDVLRGYDGNDQLKGGQGNDTLYGGNGNDTFLFNLGDGQDTIQLDDIDGIDTLAFGEGITPADLQMRKDGSYYDLVIKVGEGGDQVKVVNWFHPSYVGHRLDRFTFADGTFWDAAMLESLTSISRKNVAPVISAPLSLGEISEEGNLLITEASLLANAGDGDGDMLNVLGLTVNSGVVTDNGDGTWSYTPAPQFNGSVVFSYAITDGFVNVAAQANLRVSPLDDAPTVNGDIILGSMDTDGSRVLTSTELLAHAIDVDGDSLLITNLVANSGSLLANGDGTWAYTPDTQFAGSVRLSYGVTDGKTVIAAQASLDVGTARNDIIGTDGNAALSGTTGDDYIEALAGNDSLYGRDGNDILVGGAGNDMLYGGAGDDVFRFRLGDGQDTIQLDDAAGLDTLAFGEGISINDLTLAKDVYDLVISVGTAGDQVRLPFWFYSTSLRLDRFSFADGTMLTWEEMTAQKTVRLIGGDGSDNFQGTIGNDILEGGGGDDYLHANDGNDTLLGGADDDRLSGGNGDDLLKGEVGNDQLDGWAGDDVLIGGTGNDLISGGAGNDTFCFAVGDGADTIVLDDAEGIDTLVFGEGIAISDLAFARNGYDLIIRLGETGDQVTFSGWMYPSSIDKRVDKFVFADGAVLTSTEIGLLYPILLQGTESHDNNLSGYDGADHIIGGAGYDYLIGQDGDDILDGGSGNDYLSGGTGNDTLIGGAGYDYLYGGFGDDRFLFNRGSQYDVVWLDDATGNDTLVFGEGIGIADLSLEKDSQGLNLVIKIGNGDDRVILPDWFHPNFVGVRIDRFAFADGSVLDYDKLVAQKPIHVFGDDAGNVLSGHDGVDIIQGGNGYDTLIGGAGNDVLVGGAGNDTLHGGPDDDIFQFGLGDGQDTLQLDDINGIDTLAFGEGVILSDLQLQKVGSYDLVLKVGEAGDQVNLAYWFHPSYTAHQLDRITFADGTVRTIAEMMVQMPMYENGTAANDSLSGYEGVDVMTGGVGNDYLYGYAGSDTLWGGDGNDTLMGGNDNDIHVGGLGNDTLYGGAGDDIFRFNLGDGQDTIQHDDINGIDTLDFGECITLSDLQLQKAGSYDLVIKVGEADDQVNLAYWFHPSYTAYQLDRITFADGTVRTIAEMMVQMPMYENGTAANDSLSGYEGVDIMTGGAGNDYLYGYAGNDTLWGGDGNDNLQGGDGDDLLDGASGDDTLSGDAGNDILIGGLGNDTMDGGTGNDTYVFNAGDGADIINNYDTTGLDAISFGAGVGLTDLNLVKASNSLVVKVGTNGDQLTINNWFSGVNYQVDRFAFADGTVKTGAEILAGLPMYENGTTANDSLSGYEGVDIMTGGAGNDYLYGYAGNDTLWGGDGNDNLYAGDGNDLLDGASGDDTLSGDNGNDVLTGGLGIDTLTGDAGNDILTGGIGNDSLNGGTGDDTYIFNVGDGADTINNYDTTGVDTISFGEGIGLADINLATKAGANLILGIGTNGDQLTINNWFSGVNYQVDRFAFADGTVKTGAEILAGLPVYENGTTANDSLSGYEGVDIMTGGAGNDYLYGYAGNDTLWGGDGNDNLQGGDGDDLLDGASGDDTLTGGAGNDTLTGGIGNDTMDGGTGDDTYVFNAGDGADIINNYDTLGLDAISFGAGIGLTDLNLVKASNNLVVKVGTNGDQLTINNWFAHPYYQLDRFAFADGTVKSAAEILAGQPVYENGTTANDSLSGYEGVDIMTGNDGNDYLYGYAGNDILDGGAGADYLYAGDGNDLLDGASGDDTLSGDNGNDTLTGGIGNDSLNGGTGDDTYIFNVGDGADTINNYDTTGVDTISFGEGIGLADINLATKVGANLILGIGTNGDQLTISNWFSGSIYQVDRFAFADGTVKTGAEILAGLPVYENGTTANDSLSGYEGVDIMTGGAGNDYLYGYAGNDTLWGGDGNDNLQGGDGDDLLDGASGDDTLTGGAGNDTLTGGIGNDTMDGGTGDDTYVFNAGDGADIINNYDTLGLDAISFGAGIGLTDLNLVKASNNLVVKVGTNGDQLTITNWFSSAAYQMDRFAFADGTSVTGTELLTISPAHSIGTTANDSLSGYEGVDIMAGNDGNDYLYGYAGNDTLDGGAGADYLYGGDGADTLIGGLGNDILSGDVGNDTYVFNIGDGSDTINNYDTTGVDTISFGEGIGLADINLATKVGNNLILRIGSNGDQLTITNWFSSAAYQMDRFAFADGTSVTGTELLTISPAHSIGTTANDSLSGYEGVDIMAGNDGNDYLYGYAGNDTLGGGAGADYLYGGDGADTLIGGLGNDILSGDAGNDTYVFNVGDGADTINNYDTTGVDTISFGEGITLADLFQVKSGNNLIVKVGSNGDQLTITNWFSSAGYQMDRFAFADGTSVTGTELLTISPAHSIGTTANDSLSGYEGVDIMAGNDGNDYLYGYAGNDTLDGGAGADYLYGGDGADTLIGGLGNDILSGDVGNDTYVFNIGDGVDTINNSDAIGVDTISFGQGIALADLVQVKSGNNLIVKVGSNGDQLTITNWFSSAAYQMDRFAFADGTSVTGTELLTISPAHSIGTTVADSLSGYEGVDIMAGNDGNDYLYGYAGNDTLDGGAGADYLYGGLGDDIYLVDSTGDIITENASEGIDTVQSSITYTLGANVENLTLTGTSAINGMGNTLNNIITGNTAVNILSGGAGNDTYSFSLGGGADAINNNDAAGFDIVSLGAGIGQTSVGLFRNGNNLEIGYSDIDTVSVSNYFSDANSMVDKVNLADGSYLSSADINQIIQDIAAYAVNEGIALTSMNDVRNNEQLMSIVANSWHA